MRPQVRLAVQAGQANARRQDAKEKEERQKRNETKGETEKGTKAKGKKTVDGEPSSELPATTKTSNKKGENVPVAQAAPKGKTEFDTLSSRKPKRLNDIVDAPPDMLALLKKNKVLQKTAKGGEVFGKKDVVPPEQKRMMELEREKAIRRYREMKEKRQDGRKREE